MRDLKIAGIICLYGIMGIVLLNMVTVVFNTGNIYAVFVCLVAFAYISLIATKLATKYITRLIKQK